MEGIHPAYLILVKNQPILSKTILSLSYIKHGEKYNIMNIAIEFPNVKIVVIAQKC